MTEKHDRIDVEALRARVDIVEVIGARVPLTKSGAEFEACCPFHNEATPSFKVSPAKGFYHCFGCGAHGDAIKFLQEMDGLSFLDACRALGADVPESNTSARAEPSKPAANEGTGDTPAPGQRETPPASEAKKRPEWAPVIPVPDDAPPPPKAHEFRGLPSHTWAYRAADGRLNGYVCRFVKSDGGKEVLPLVWARHPERDEHAWRWLSWAEPRPLMHLDALAARPEATVLVVEGEKCAQAAAAELPDLVVVTWPGGGKAVDKADWSPLAGRKVIGWADCDAKRVRVTPAEAQEGVNPAEKPFLSPEKQPGLAAMAKVAGHVLALGGRWWDVEIPAPGAVADGWDVADAIADGLTGEALAQHIRDHIHERLAEAPGGPPEPPSTPTEAGAGEEKKRPFVPGLIYKKGDLADCLANVFQILLYRPEWDGVIAWDEFSLRTIKRRPPPYACEDAPLGDWTDTDDARTAMWLSREYGDRGFLPSSARVAEAVQVLARAHAFHPVREWLRSLVWDGTPRLDFWAADYLGTPASEYTQRAGRWWIMGAVARVLWPGCKFDYCLVLEGPQGKGKSTVLSILGGEWFGDTDLDFANKDSMVALGGKLIYELAELGALARSDERRQKSFLSRRIDEYRPHYGRSQIKAPRQLVFGGSTNEWEWNKDPTGGRRFWPLGCEGELDLEGLRQARDQLFAEAFHRVQAGERYWPTAEEQRQWFDPEQLRVEQPEALVDALHDWVYSQTRDFSLAEAAIKGLKLDASKLTRDMQTRVGQSLKKLGCSRVEKRNGMTRFWYKPPTSNGASSKGNQPAQLDGEGGYAPF